MAKQGFKNPKHLLLAMALIGGFLLYSKGKNNQQRKSLNLSPTDVTSVKSGIAHSQLQLGNATTTQTVSDQPAENGKTLSLAPLKNDTLTYEQKLIDQVSLELNQQDLDFVELEKQHRIEMSRYSGSELWVFSQAAISKNLDGNQRLASFYLLKLAQEKTPDHFSSIVESAFENETHPQDTHSAEFLAYSFEVNLRTMAISELEKLILEKKADLQVPSSKNSFINKLSRMLEVSRRLERPLVAELLNASLGQAQ